MNNFNFNFLLTNLYIITSFFFDDIIAIFLVSAGLLFVISAITFGNKIDKLDRENKLDREIEYMKFKIISKQLDTIINQNDLIKLDNKRKNLKWKRS